MTWSWPAHPIRSGLARNFRMYEYCPKLAAAVHTDETKSISISSLKRSFGHASEKFTAPQLCYPQKYCRKAMTSRPCFDPEPHHGKFKLPCDHMYRVWDSSCRKEEPSSLLEKQMAVESGLSHTVLRFILFNSYKYDGQHTSKSQSNPVFVFINLTFSSHSLLK